MGNNNQQSSHILGMSDSLMKKIMIIEQEDNGDRDNFEIKGCTERGNIMLIRKKVRSAP